MTRTTTDQSLSVEHRWTKRLLIGSGLVFVLGLLIDGYFPESTRVEAHGLFFGSLGSLLMMIVGIAGGVVVGGRAVARWSRSTS